MDLSLKQLEYIARISRHGSLSEVADAMGVTQPAVSTALAKIERDLGVALFERHGGRIRLNATGRLLAPQVTQFLASYHKAVESAACSGCREMHPETSILIEPSPWTDFLRLLENEAPGVSVGYHSMVGEPGAGLRSQYDCFVQWRHMPAEFPDGYNCVPIGEVRGMCSVVSSAFTAAGDDPLRIHEDAIDVVMPSEDMVLGIRQAVRGISWLGGILESVQTDGLHCFDQIAASCMGPRTLGLLPGDPDTWRSRYGGVLTIRDIAGSEDVVFSICLCHQRGPEPSLFARIVDFAMAGG